MTRISRGRNDSDRPYRALMTAFTSMAKMNLRGVWAHGLLPEPPVIWAANHHGWWDGFVGGLVLDRAGHRATLLMDSDNLQRFSVFGPLDLVPHDRPRAALQALAAGRSLIIFPEGQMQGPGPLGSLHRGAAWLADKADVPLVPVAMRAILRGNQRPEALLRIGSPVDGADLADAMAGELSSLDVDIAAGDPSRPLDGYSQVLAGRRSMDELITSFTRR